MSIDLTQRLKPSQLRLLIKIAESGQLQAAAHLTAMSQPAASRALSDIETLFGSPLFKRHPKGMEPTPLGKIVLRHSVNVLETLDTLASEAGRFSGGELGHVRIGAVTGPAVGSLMPAVRQIKSDWPDIEFTIEVGPSTTMVRGLVEDRFDLVVSRLPPNYDSRDFHLHPARSEQIVLVTNPEHQLANQKAVLLKDTLDFNWVIQEVGSPIRQAVEAAFFELNLATPSNMTNSSSMVVALSLLNDPNTISPQAREVAELLVESKLNANLSILDLETPISVSPCYVIENRYRPQSEAAERVKAALFRWL